MTERPAPPTYDEIHNMLDGLAYAAVSEQLLTGDRQRLFIVAMLDGELEWEAYERSPEYRAIIEMQTRYLLGYAPVLASMARDASEHRQARLKAELGRL